MRKKVNYAKLHGGDAFVPGLGGLSTTLPPTSKSFAKFDMFYTDTGLVLDIVDQKGSTYECCVPTANVQIVVFAPEEKKTLKAV